LYNLWAWELNESGECDMVPKWVKFQSEIGPWLSGTIYSYVPIVLLVVLNSLLCYKLWDTRKSRQAKLGLNKGAPLSDSAERKVTITVVVICLAYILLTTPLALFYVILFLAGEFINPGPELALGECLILILGLSNHAINLFLYVLTSSRFRSEMWTMLRCGKNKTSSRGGRSSAMAATSNARATPNTGSTVCDTEKSVSDA
jgi:growth hormone secretagogue receptor